MRRAVPQLVTLGGLMSLCTVLWLFFSRRARWRGWLPVVLCSALLLRLLFVGRSPELSDDLYRYVWDGLQLLSGHNPYAVAPADVQVASAAEAALQPLINHPQLVTLYPPLAQGLFALAGGSVTGWKLLAVAFDFGNCLLLVALLRALQRPVLGVVLYAWQPLAIIESAASAHVDVTAVFFLLLALLLARNAQSLFLTFSALSLAGAVLVKVLPVLVLPLFLIPLDTQRRIRFLLIFLIVSLVACLLFWPELRNGLSTLGLYTRHWEFSGFLFRQLREGFGSGDHARLLLGALLSAGLLWIGLRLRSVPSWPAQVRCMAVLLLLFLLLTPTLHPWYALYLCALLPLVDGALLAAGMALSWSVLLSYQVVALYAASGQWCESSRLAAYVFSAPVSALILSSALRRTRRKI